MAGIYKETELGGLFAPPSPAPPQPAPDARTRRQIGPARAAAEKRRDRALKAAERPQLAAYRDQALAFFRSFAETHEFVFCDDLWAAGMPEPPGSRKAFGAVMAKAKRNGWIEETGETRQSVSSNLSKKPVYRSLLYRGHVGQAS